MKLLFISDTHGDLPLIMSNIDFSDIDLIILLGDNTEIDLDILRNINIPKIGVLGNHKFRGSDGNKGILEDYGIIDISFKKYEFNGLSFYGIDGSVSYQLVEDIEEKNNKFKIFNPNINLEIESYKEKKQDLFKQKNIDFLISHFPSRGIMDTNSFSHRGLKLIKEFIESASPKYFLHGHLHNPGEEKFIETKIIQVYKTYILNLNG